MSGHNRGKIPSIYDVFGLPPEEAERLDAHTAKHGIKYECVPPGELFVHRKILWRKYPFGRELKPWDQTGAYNSVAEHNEEMRAWFELWCMVEFPKRDIDSEWSASKED